MKRLGCQLQGFHTILRAKKMIVLGDRKQFSNVKTSNASKDRIRPILTE